MPNKLIDPEGSDTARAVEETAKAAAKAIDAAREGGQYAATVLGDLPRDLFGLLGDWIKHVRMRRWAELSAETDKISAGNVNRSVSAGEGY